MTTRSPQSVPAQINRSLKYAERIDWEVSDVHHDVGRSGATMAVSASFSRMMAAADRGELDVELVEGLARLSRIPSEGQGVVDKLATSSVTVFVLGPEETKLDRQVFKDCNAATEPDDAELNSAPGLVESVS